MTIEKRAETGRCFIVQLYPWQFHDSDIPEIDFIVMPEKPYVTRRPKDTRML